MEIFDSDQKFKISDILEEKKNFLINRKEIKVIVKAEKNPNREEASSILEKEFKADKENIVVKGVKGKFGRNTFLISAFIYDSKEDKEKFEPKEKEKKQKKSAGEEKKEEKAEVKTEEKDEGKKEGKKDETTEQ